MPAAVNPDLCVGCETCVDECPAEAITMEDGIAKVDKKKCTECKTCRTSALLQPSRWNEGERSPFSGEYNSPIYR